MSKKGFKKRLFASIFSFYFVVFQFFMVPSALAWPTFDLFGASWEPIQKILGLIGKAGEGAFKTSVSTALSYFLQTMAKDVATGIVSGSVGQEPLFRVETFSATLKNAADNATGVFLDDLSERGFDTLGLCKPVSVQSISSAEGDLTKWLADVMKDLTDKLNLIPDFGEYDLTNKTPTCTVSKIMENMENNIEYIISYYFEYFFLDVFKKNCNVENMREFENNLSKVTSSMFNITFGSLINPFDIIPSAEELAGAFETLNQSTDYDFQCAFFVCKNENEKFCSGEDVNWVKTSEKLINESLYPVVRNSLQMAFGGSDGANISATAEETLKYQIKKNCKEMAEGVDDDVLSSLIDSNKGDFHLSSNFDFIDGVILNTSSNKKLFNDVVFNMNPYYIYPDKDLNYLDHFKKCVYVANIGEDGPTFLTSDKDGGEEECWIDLRKNNEGNIKYNNETLSKINTSKSYKEEIKEALTKYCMINAYENIIYLPQIARQEYNASLEKIRKYNETKREKAEKEVEITTPNDEIAGTTDPIARNNTGTSVQTTQMVEAYQNSMQDFLTPTGDVFLDAAKLFLSTLLQGYFDELKKGIFKLPDNFAFNDFENFGRNFAEQFEEFDFSDLFEDGDWGEVIGIPKTDSVVGQNCIMNSNCASGLCDFVGANKVCVECDKEGYTCGGSDICHENKCVECVVDVDCETGKTCSSSFTCVMSE